MYDHEHLPSSNCSIGFKATNENALLCIYTESFTISSCEIKLNYLKELGTVQKVGYLTYVLSVKCFALLTDKTSLSQFFLI